MFLCTCWLLLLWFVRSGNGSTARRHFICDFVYIENKQHYQVLASWRQRFTVRRWFLYSFSFEKLDSNRTSDTVLSQWYPKVGGREWIPILNSHSPKQCACIFRSFLSANVDPELKLYGASIPVVNEFKFLGLIFDKKLTFKQHIRYLKDRCFKALNCCE